MMNSKGAEKWIQIRQELYRHVKARVQRRLGRETPALTRYRCALEKDFARGWMASELDELISGVAESDLVFFGDFHALQQSQKTHLRILKRLSAGRAKVLALECFPARKQKILDDFQSGKISEAQFLAKVRWKEDWGFPWANYAPLLQWARDQEVPVYGIDGAAAQDMRARDRFAAREIQKIRKKQMAAQIFVIYGDLHLALDHLPKLLKKEKQIRILQNAEALYFRELKKNKKSVTEVLRKGRAFCILNVPPWVKWQNYLMFLEETYDESLRDSIDYTDHVVEFIKLLSEELGLRVPHHNLSVYTAKDPGFWEKLTRSCRPAEIEWVSRLVKEDVVFFLAGSGVGYLSRASVNQAASLAMEYIVAQTAGLDENILQIPRDFTRWIWMNGWSYFGGKVINPKRKTETLTDIKLRMTTGRGKLEREPLQLALAQRWAELSLAAGHSLPRKRFKPRRRQSYVIAAELLGGLMGEKIYEAYQRGLLSASQIKKTLHHDLLDPDFQKKYFNFIQFLEQVPLSFKSKEEKI